MVKIIFLIFMTKVVPTFFKESNYFVLCIKKFCLIACIISRGYYCTPRRDYVSFWHKSGGLLTKSSVFVMNQSPKNYIMNAHVYLNGLF